MDSTDSSSSFSKPSFRLNMFNVNVSQCEVAQKSTEEFSNRCTSITEKTNINVFGNLLRESTLILCSSSNQSQTPCNVTDENDQPTKLLKNISTSVFESPFHLIKNISDGSVSLESIPTINLFKPDPDEFCHVDSEGLKEAFQEPNEDKPCCRTMIVGGDKLPQSILFYIKQQQKKNEYKKKLLLSCDKSHVESPDCAEDGNDTDSENVDSTSDVIGEKEDSVIIPNPLQTHDTVILDSDKCSTTKAGLTAFDTLILNEIDQEQSLNQISPVNIEMPLDNNVPNRAFSVDIGQVLSLENSSHLPSTEIFKKTIYFMSADGQLATVSFTPEQSLASSVNQVRLMKNCEAKSTQTELVFGTGNLFFKSLENSQEEHFCSDKEQPCEVPDVERTFVSGSDGKSRQGTKAMWSKDYDNIITVGKSLDDDSVQNILESKLQIPDGIHQNIPTISVPCNDLLKNKVPMFKCIECHKEFSSKLEFNKHDKTHSKVFQCDLCNAKFTRLGNFTRHRKIHNLQPENQPLFKCETCDREFLQRCDLKRHMLIHTNQEPHRCDKCGKGYIRRSDLVVHLRFHNKDKAFMCDKKFFQTGDLSRHIRRAHKPSSQLTCGHCDRKYACETTLLRHMKARHKDIILHTVHQRLQETEASSGVI
ncbi:hypothetical protein Btru_026162 [Bulinus truncatus]|nr:hypothetical protein Btru_026162 [Bulinus truncatus]